MFHVFDVLSQYAAAVERADAALAARFPRHIPGVRDGWLILSRSGRPISVWDLKKKTGPDTPEQEAKRNWTHVHLATARTLEQADRRCADFTRAQDTLDAQVASGSLPAGSHAAPDITA